MKNILVRIGVMALMVFATIEAFTNHYRSSTLALAGVIILLVLDYQRQLQTAQKAD